MDLAHAAVIVRIPDPVPAAVQRRLRAAWSDVGYWLAQSADILPAAGAVPVIELSPPADVKDVRVWLLARILASLAEEVAGTWPAPNTFEPDPARLETVDPELESIGAREMVLDLKLPPGDEPLRQVVRVSARLHDVLDGYADVVDESICPTQARWILEI